MPGRPHRVATDTTGATLRALLNTKHGSSWKWGFGVAVVVYIRRISAESRLSIRLAELIIAASHRMHGEWYGNFEEFRFFTALRHSEQFALELSDCDLANGKISVTKAVVDGQMKNRTKTNQDRENQSLSTGTSSVAGAIEAARTTGRRWSDQA